MALSLGYGGCSIVHWHGSKRGYANVRALSTSENENQKRRIQESLSEVSSSLNALSDAIAKVSSAVKQLADAVSGENEEGDLLLPPPQMIERYTLSHNLAFRLQQSFLTMRLEGLGKPFEVAAEEFVSACMAARNSGTSMEELQLQLILADGALPGAFAMKMDDPSASYIMSEEARVRAAWVRYLYVTFSEVEALKFKDLTGSAEQVEEVDPSDLFVKEVIKGAVEQGYNLAKLKLEQELSGPPSSPSVRTLRQSNFLILLAFEKLN